jgi:hypothetical protein
MQTNHYPPLSESGIPEGVFYGQNARVEELNDRVNSRYFPDLALAPNYGPRPTPTKRTQFPMVNMRAVPTVGLNSYTDFSTKNNFYPGTQAAPPQGFDVEAEMRLRNQYFALQHCDQNVYVPSTESDLYKVEVVSRPTVQPHPDLFATPTFHTSAYQDPAIGKDLFYNNTRIQLRNELQN